MTMASYLGMVRSSAYHFPFATTAHSRTELRRKGALGRGPAGELAWSGALYAGYLTPIAVGYHQHRTKRRGRSGRGTGGGGQARALAAQVLLCQWGIEKRRKLLPAFVAN